MLTGKSKNNQGKSPVDQCLWMQAGVVKRKDCLKRFECAACRFDRAMVHAAEENWRILSAGGKTDQRKSGIVFWKDMLRQRPLAMRPCVHHMKKRIEFRLCNHDYRCSDCEFDQFFMDQFAVHTVVRPVGFLDVEGFALPQGYYLHPGHAWTKLEDGGDVRVGIDDFAMRLFGPFDGIASPLVGKDVTAGEPAMRVRRADRTAVFLSPVSGVVTSINAELCDNGGPAEDRKSVV